MPGTMADIGYLDQIVRNDPVDDAITIFCSEKCPITLEGIEHGRTYFGKIAKEFEFGDNLILDREGKSLQFSLSPRKKLNLSWHAWPFWL